MAGIAEDAGKALLEVATVEEGVDDIVDEATPVTAGALEALFPLALDLLVARIEQLLKGSLDEALLARKESIRRGRSLAR